MPRDQIVKRVVLSFVLALVLAIAIAEIPFLLLRENARPPKEITLVIPAGTADQVARGQQPPGIPENMAFVVGDTLTVKNEDVVDHQLGPLWIPASTSAQLSLDRVESLAYECSFQPGNYLGLDVHEAVTLGTRIYGILFVAIPLGVLFALYSLVIAPKKNEDVPA